MPKTLVGLPTNRLIKPKTAQSLLSLNGKFDTLISTRGYNTAENRNHIAAQAVKGGYDYLLLVDDDMIYEPDNLEKLLESNKDIVGGLYKTKYENQEYVLESDEIKDTMFECEAIGGGLLLIKTEVFKKVPQPWFGYLWHSNGMVKESNDWYFCRKARETGYKIWCNPEITAKHIGLRCY